MNVDLPREIFINDKLERFAFIALVYWDAVYMNVYCVVIYRLQNSRFLDFLFDCSRVLEYTKIRTVLQSKSFKDCSFCLEQKLCF